MRNAKYDRPEVKIISKQWVRENCKNITERDMGLLRLLYESKRRLLRRDQIERLYPQFASTDRLNKRLSLLYKLHVIDKIYPQVGIGEGSSKQYICLDRAGIILLDLEGYNKPIESDRHGNRSLFSGWEHKVMLNEYECIIKGVVCKLGGGILSYEVEEPNLYNDTKLIPDILCLIKIKGKGHLFYIECDMGTENIPYIKSKIDSYKDYYMSNRWVTRGWAKLFKKPVFPRILFLSEEGKEKRLKALRGYTEESGLRWQFGFHSGLENLLEEKLST